LAQTWDASMLPIMWHAVSVRISLRRLAVPNVHCLLDAEGSAGPGVARCSSDSDHYLCAWGELSSSGLVFHPGERPTRNRSPLRGL